MTFGYKIHVAVEEDGFIKATAYSAGNEHDSLFLAELLSGNESAVYADSAYKSAKHDEMLAKMGIKNCILERAYRNKPLNNNQKKENRLNSGVRCIVELRLDLHGLQLKTWAGHSASERLPRAQLRLKNAKIDKKWAYSLKITLFFVLIATNNFKNSKLEPKFYFLHFMSLFEAFVQRSLIRCPCLLDHYKTPRVRGAF